MPAAGCIAPTRWLIRDILAMPSSTSYSGCCIVGSFVGFAPVSDPRLIVAVMIDEPSNGKHFGGDVAAPVFAQVMGASLRSLGVPPDAPLRPLVTAATEWAREEM